MSNFVDAIYRSLPTWVQNAAISAYGFRQRSVRYGDPLPEPYPRVFEATLAPAEIKQLQNQRLQALLAHAAEYVPHYVDLFQRLRLKPADVTVDNLSAVLPVLEKREVVADPSRFHSRASLKSDLKLFTSGTSGSPMPILCRREARALNYAYFRKIIRQNGSDVTDRSVTFAGRVLFSSREKRQFWRKDFVNSTLYCSSYYISSATLPLYVRAMEEWRPRYIDSYPSAIHEVARWINENNVAHSIRPQFVFTSSETLTDVQRADIEKAFATRVVDQYGCTEMAVMAYTSGDGYLVEPMYSLFEPLEAEEGAVVCTGLLNFAMPLIRYRIGDLVTGARSDSESPYQTTSFARIVGREDDCIVTPEGRRIGRMDPVFKGVTGIAKAQIVQSVLDQLDVLIVRAATGPALDEDLLTRNIRGRTSPNMRINYRYVQEIPATKAGKFKSVVSKLKSAATKDEA